MNTLFDVTEFEETNPRIVRYAVKIVDISDDSTWYFRKGTPYHSDDTGEEVFELDSEPRVRGVKLPKLYKSHHGARAMIETLYKRVKQDVADSVRIQVEVWSRQPDDDVWTVGA